LILTALTSLSGVADDYLAGPGLRFSYSWI
jgi:hypothetical protein